MFFLSFLLLLLPHSLVTPTDDDETISRISFMYFMLLSWRKKMRKEKVKSVLNRLSSFLCGVDSFSLVAFFAKKEKYGKSDNNCAAMFYYVSECISCSPPRLSRLDVVIFYFLVPLFSVFPILLCLSFLTLSIFFSHALELSCQGMS